MGRVTLAFLRSSLPFVVLFVGLALVDLFADIELTATIELTELLWTIAMLYGAVRVAQLFSEAVKTLRDAQRNQRLFDESLDVLDFAWARIETASFAGVVIGYFLLAGVTALLQPPPVTESAANRMEDLRLVALLIGALTVFYADRTMRRLARRTRRRESRTGGSV